MKKFIFLISLLLIVSACSSDSNSEEEATETPETTAASSSSESVEESASAEEAAADFSVETILAKSYEGDACAVFEEVERDYFIVYGYADMTNAPKVLDYETFDEWVNAYQNFQSDDPEFENVLTMVNKLSEAKEEAKANNCSGVER